MSILTAPLKLVGRGAWGATKGLGRFLGRHKMATAFGAMQAHQKYKETGDLGTAALAGGLGYGLGELGTRAVGGGINALARSAAKRVANEGAKKAITMAGAAGGLIGTIGVYSSPLYTKADRAVTGTVAGVLDRTAQRFGAKDMFKRARTFANTQSKIYNEAKRLKQLAKQGQKNILGKLGQLQGVQGVKNRRPLMNPELFQSKYYTEQMKRAKQLQEWQQFNRPELLNMKPL